MQTAADGLRAALADLRFALPRTPVVSNVSAEPIKDPADIPDELVSQVTSPVLWARSVQYMRDAGVTTLIEFGPGRVLTGLARRIDRDLVTRNIGTVDDLTQGAAG
jgi:[acyl-carrier-protein] S-malonyltransferase